MRTQFKTHMAALAMMLVLPSCTSTSMHHADAKPPLVLLYFDGCPMTTTVRRNLERALEERAQPRFAYASVDLRKLDSLDDRLRWGSPTILVDGQDLFNMTPASTPGLSCRIYDHIPSSREIQVALARRWCE